MLRLVLFLVAAAALAWAAVWVADHPGTVMVRWLDQELVLSVGTVVAVALAFAAVVIVLFELFRLLGGLPRRTRISRVRGREKQGYQELTRGLMAAAAGDLAAARAHYRQGERHMPDNPGLLLLAAQTAQLEGKEEVAYLKFRKMIERPETELVGLRGLLAQTMRTGDREEALKLARRAYRRSPTTPWVLSTLFELLTRGEQWEEALGLVDEMRAQQLLREGEARRHKAILHHMVASRLRQQDRTQDALAQERRAVKSEPGFAPAAVQAAELAAQLGRRRLALRILEDAWRAAPHPDIGRAYAELDPNESLAMRLHRVDTRLAPLNRDHVETKVLQAELAMRAEKWDVARAQLESAVAAEPTPRIYRLLAELERASTGDQASAQQWLSRAGDALPDRAWVCEDTGEVLPAWQPFATSGLFDGVRWNTPPKVATLAGPDRSTSYILPRDEPSSAVDDESAAPARPESESRARGGSPSATTTIEATAAAAS